MSKPWDMPEPRDWLWHVYETYARLEAAALTLTRRFRRP